MCIHPIPAAMESAGEPKPDELDEILAHRDEDDGCPNSSVVLASLLRWLRCEDVREN